jgi:single-strand DNA-binding protein
MNGINKIFLAGNIVKKPALHKNKNGKTFSFLRMATNRFSYNQGKWDKRTDWHSILVWGKKAELCERFLDKGTPLAVEGFLENSQDDKIMVIAEDVHFLGIRTAQEKGGESWSDEADEADENGEAKSSYMDQKESLPF